MGTLFKSLGQLIWSHIEIVLIVIAAITVLIFIIIRISKVIKKKKELRRAASDRTRDENLNSFILNSHSTTENKEIYVPYEVDYSNHHSDSSPLSENAVMVQIIEQTGLSQRKFALNAAKGIRIGTSSENDISFICDEKDEYCCEIIAPSKDVYVRNICGNTRAFIKRKKNQAIVDTKGIKLKSGDVIIIGSNTYTITIVK